MLLNQGLPSNSNTQTLKLKNRKCVLIKIVSFKGCVIIVLLFRSTTSADIKADRGPEATHLLS